MDPLLRYMPMIFFISIPRPRRQMKSTKTPTTERKQRIALSSRACSGHMGEGIRDSTKGDGWARHKSLRGGNLAACSAGHDVSLTNANALVSGEILVQTEGYLFIQQKEVPSPSFPVMLYTPEFLQPQVTYLVSHCINLSAPTSSSPKHPSARQRNPLSVTPPHHERSSHSSDGHCTDSASRAPSVI